MQAIILPGIERSIYRLVKNNSKIQPATNLSLEFNTEDIRVAAVAQSVNMDDIAAGTEGLSNLTSFNFAQGYNPDSTINHPIHFEVTVFSNGYPFWTTSFEFKDTAMGMKVKDILLTTELALHQNYPNPFNPSTKITFTLPITDLVKLEVYNTLGQLVRTLVEDELQVGSHEYEFNASHLPSGLYFYRFQAGDWIDTKKMLLIK